MYKDHLDEYLLHKLSKLYKYQDQGGLLLKFYFEIYYNTISHKKFSFYLMVTHSNIYWLVDN